MIADTRPKRGIREEGNQISLRKQRHEAPSPVAMSSTSQLSTITSWAEDYWEKSRIPQPRNETGGRRIWLDKPQ
jgi:hypothetical protein